MSDRPPRLSDPAAIEIPDEVLGEHLARRASRPAPRALAASIMARVDGTVPERRWRLAVAAWRPRMAWAASGLALVLVVALLAINAMPVPVGTVRGSPTAGASAVPSSPYWDPTQRALTPPELQRILATHPAKGTTLIVDDQIVAALVSCPTFRDCATGQLVNADTFVTAPPNAYLPFGDGTTIPGPLALQVGSGPNLVFLGAVVSNGLRLEFAARDLAQRSAMGGLFVIPGWIHRGAVVPCPSIVAPHAPLPTSELGLPAPEVSTCSGGVYLTDSNPGPPPYGAGGGDPNAFPVQQEAYQLFASDPADGTASRGVFLVRDWAGYGEVLAGLQPIGIPTIDASAPRIGTTWIATERPLAPAELVRVLAQQPPVGTVLIVDDEIAEAVFDCASPGACPSGTLIAAGTLVYAPVGGRLPVMPRVPGPLAFRIGDSRHLVFLGSVAHNGPTMDFTATDLAPVIATDGLYVVPAWLWRRGPAGGAPVVTVPPPTPTSELGLPAPPTDICDGANYLTDDAPTLPLTSLPHDGILVQHRAYEDFAPSPDDVGTARLAVYLVRNWGDYGEIVGRLEPVEIPAATSVGPGPSTEPTTPASPASRVMPVDEFVGRVLDGSLPAGALVASDIPASAVTVLSPTAAGGPENPNRSRWAIAAGAGSIRVDGVAKDGITGIAGTQAFLVEQSDAVRALGPVATDGVASKGFFIVHGWLRSGPAVPCPAPLAGKSPPVIGISGQPLVWSQCTGMWILPTAADPWAGPPNRIDNPDGTGNITFGDHSVLPVGTMHVQDAADDLALREPDRRDLARSQGPDEHLCAGRVLRARAARPAGARRQLVRGRRADRGAGCGQRRAASAADSRALGSLCLGGPPHRRRRDEEAGHDRDREGDAVDADGVDHEQLEVRQAGHDEAAEQAEAVGPEERPPIGGPPPGDRQADEHDREADSDECDRDPDDLAVRRGRDVLAAVDRPAGRCLAEELRGGQVDRDDEPDERKGRHGQARTAVHGAAEPPVAGAVGAAPLPAGDALGAAAAMRPAIVA